MRLLLIALILASSSAASAQRLLGVDEAGKQAFVSYGEGTRIETVDLASGTVVDTWSVSADTAADQTGTYAYLQFSSSAGDRADDLRQLGDFVTRAGLATRAYWTNGQRTASGAMFVDGSGLIHLTGKNGAEVATVGDSSAVSQKVAPDGKRVAWASWGVDATSVSIAATDGTGETTTRATGQLRGMQWAPDSASLLALDTDANCVMRYPAKTLKPKKLHCGGERHLSSFAQSADGKRIAVVGADGATGTSTVTWIDSKRGKVKGSAELTAHASYAVEDFTLSDTGLFAGLDSSGGLLVADLARGAAAELSADHAYFEGVRATRWIGASIVVLDGSEVRVVDVEKLLP